MRKRFNLEKEAKRVLVDDSIDLSNGVEREKTTGMAFFGPLPIALHDAQSYVGKSGHILTIPELIHGRLVTSDDSYLNTATNITANSEEIIGTTKHGASVVIVVHGGGILSSPSRIISAYINGEMKDRGIVLHERDVHFILSGKLPQNGFYPPSTTGFGVYDHKEFLEKGHLPAEGCAIVIDSDTAKKHPIDGMCIEYEKAKDNPIFAAYCGGFERLRSYLDKMRESDRDIRGYPDFYQKLTSRCTVRPLRLLEDSASFWIESCPADIDGHFIAVKR